jgi:hypothetical protein
MSTRDAADSLLEDLSHKFLEVGAERELKPYLTLLQKGITRCMNLVEEAKNAKPETSADMLRAVVVLNHAHLEDFLRTIAASFLPRADENALNAIPLMGLGHRPEKFFLGKLAKHRGKTVDEVLRLSVSEHMERSNFNNMREIVDFLGSMGLQIPDTTDPSKVLELAVNDNTRLALNAMIQRRHHIVHQADKAKTGDGLQEIDPAEVAGWVAATMMFMLSVTTVAFTKRYSLEEFKKFVLALHERATLGR